MTSPGNSPEVAWERLDALYRETILDHARNPRNRQPVAAPDIRGHMLNPFCGDEVWVDVALAGGRVSGVHVHSEGCAICQSSASMMGEALKGRTVPEMRALITAFTHMLRGKELTDVDWALLGGLKAMQGVASFPVRVKCAVLAWSALEVGLDLFQKPPTRHPAPSKASPPV
jgi:nitrogen fixation NifU-like protein